MRIFYPVLLLLGLIVLSGISSGVTTSVEKENTALLKCQITMRLENVKLSAFPLQLMPNETAVFCIRIIEGEKIITSGNCSISIYDAKKVPINVDIKTSLNGQDFTSKVKISYKGYFGTWTAVAMWYDKHVSIVNSTTFNVIKPSLNLKNIKYNPSKKIVEIQSCLIDTQSNLEQYSITALILTRGIPPPSGKKHYVLSSPSFTVLWNMTPTTFIYPDSQIYFDFEIINNANYTQELRFTTSLKIPLSLKTDATTIKKSSLAISSINTTIKMKSYERIYKKVNLSVPSQYAIGVNGIFPLRFSSKAFVNIDVWQNKTHVTGIAPLQILPGQLLVYKISKWINTTADTYGNFRLSINIIDYNFTLFLLGTKISGEYVTLFRSISLIQPQVKYIGAEFNGTDVLLNASIYSMNRISSALFQYSTDKTDWKNITFDTDSYNGWNAHWNITGLPPGNYYIKISVQDEYGLSNQSITTITIPGPPPNYLLQIVIGIIIICIFLVSILVLLRGYLKRKRLETLELNAISSLRKILKDESYRPALIAAFGIFLALNKKYENIEYMNNWNMLQFKRVLRDMNLLSPSLGIFLDDYREARFSPHPARKIQAQKAFRTLINYRMLLINRLQKRKKKRQ